MALELERGKNGREVSLGEKKGKRREGGRDERDLDLLHRRAGTLGLDGESLEDGLIARRQSQVRVTAVRRDLNVRLTSLAAHRPANDAWGDGCFWQ